MTIDLRATLHPATDHLLAPSLSHLTGSDVVLSGRKADGTPYSDRRLDNVSFVPRGGSVFAVGMDPQAGGIRQFDLRGVERLVAPAGGPESPAEAFERSSVDLDWAGVRRVLANALQELRKRSEGGPA